MHSRAVAFPVSEGKSDEVRRVVDELVQGERAEQFHNLRRRHGFERVKVFHQHEPQEMVIVYMEARDMDAAARARAEEDHEFERWFESRMHEVHGSHVSEHGGTELLLDWHRDHGASRTGHAT